MINAERIAEMKRLSAEATPGPWVTGKPLHAHKSYITRGSRLGLNVANAYHYEDAQFIAESRQFVPDIIAAYEEQAVELRLTKIENERLQALADFEVKCTIAANQEIAKLRKALTDIYNADDELTLAEHSRLSLEIAGEALK